MEINDRLIAKLASIVVHADEIAERTTSSISTLELIQLKDLIESEEVRAFIKEAGALAPVKRT